MQGKNKRKDIYIIVDAVQGNSGSAWLGCFKFTELEMIVSVLIVYFKLWEALMSDFFLTGIECIQLFFTVRAFMIVAFVNGDFLTFFPCKERF